MRDGQLPLAALPPLEERPRVSVIIPAYNEARFIGACLESIEAQTYPAELIDVIVADGRSTDRTREIVAEHQAAGRLASLRLIDNPHRSTAEGRNAGILAASSPIISTLDAHAVAAPTYIESAVKALRRTGAAAVGGPWDTAGSTPTQSAIAAAMSHPFGIGDARYRFSGRAEEVATVGFGTYRRECFEVVGGYDVTRDKGEDDHLNFRIREAGGRLWLDPSIRVTYFARPSLGALARQFNGYGRAKGRAMVDERRLIRPHHVVPAASVLATLGLLAASPVSKGAKRWLRRAIGLYVVSGAASAYHTTARRDERRLAPITFIAFATIHTSYGIGSLQGIVATWRSHRKARLAGAQADAVATTEPAAQGSWARLKGFASALRDRSPRAGEPGTGAESAAASLASLPPMEDEPLVTVVIPAYNEERYIGACLDSLAAQTYPAERIEVLVTDGGSTDQTREIVASHHGKLADLRLVDNPDRTANHGLHLGVELAKGGVIIILGAHAAVDTRFVEENVRALRDTGAAAVGGPINTVGDSPLANAIAAALSHPFGVGDARFRTSEVAGYVDTIAFAAYRRECFELIGNFDVTREKRVDDQYNWRIRRAGGELYLTPRIRSTYFARSDYRELARQYFGYGKAKGRAMVEEPRSIGLRHLVPGLTVISGASLAALALFVGRARLLLSGATLAYGALAAFSAQRATKKRGMPDLTLRAALAFPVIHAAYGLGTLRGIVASLRSRPS